MSCMCSKFRQYFDFNGCCLDSKHDAQTSGPLDDFALPMGQARILLSIICLVSFILLSELSFNLCD